MSMRKPSLVQAALGLLLYVLTYLGIRFVLHRNAVIWHEVPAALVSGLAFLVTNWLINR